MAGQVAIFVAHIDTSWRKLTLAAATGSVLEFTEIIPKLMNPGESLCATWLVARVNQNCMASMFAAVQGVVSLISIDILFHTSG